jgi:hypothetical protein
MFYYYPQNHIVVRVPLKDTEALGSRDIPSLLPSVSSGDVATQLSSAETD